jgi:hypothetical protein
MNRLSLLSQKSTRSNSRKSYIADIIKQEPKRRSFMPDEKKSHDEKKDTRKTFWDHQDEQNSITQCESPITESHAEQTTSTEPPAKQVPRVEKKKVRKLVQKPFVAPSYFANLQSEKTYDANLYETYEKKFPTMFLSSSPPAKIDRADGSELEKKILRLECMLAQLTFATVHTIDKKNKKQKSRKEGESPENKTESKNKFKEEKERKVKDEVPQVKEKARKDTLKEELTSKIKERARNEEIKEEVEAKMKEKAKNDALDDELESKMKQKASKDAMKKELELKITERAERLGQSLVKSQSSLSMRQKSQTSLDQVTAPIVKSASKSTLIGYDDE